MGPPFDVLSQLPRPFGPFTLIRLIAQGGMGQVFLALRPVPDEPHEICVVKTVRSDLKDDREAVGRFLDEARVVQKLDHDAICHTLDAGIVDKTYYLALEFISGRNLRDVQTRAQKLGREMPEAVIFHAITEVLQALEYAHALPDPATGDALRIVHRDVSPHNVMLGFDGYAKLIDFGLAAHELKREMTRPGIMVGKLRYNAPEQVRDRAFDGRSDLYSVGVMLYELLAGERFYEGLSEEEIWRVAMKGTHRPRLLSSLAADVRALLDLALAPTPADRFANAADMRDAVGALMQSRRLGEVRRASSRFMSDVFAEERQLERDMILQATGLAEARTLLMPMLSMDAQQRATDPGAYLGGDSAIETGDPRTPDSAFSGWGDSQSGQSVGRTLVVSPATLRGRLASLISEFEAAETAVGNRDTIDAALSAARTDLHTARSSVFTPPPAGSAAAPSLVPLSEDDDATLAVRSTMSGLNLGAGSSQPPSGDGAKLVAIETAATAPLLVIPSPDAPTRRLFGSGDCRAVPSAAWLFAGGFALIALLISGIAVGIAATRPGRTATIVEDEAPAAALPAPAVAAPVDARTARERPSKPAVPKAVDKPRPPKRDKRDEAKRDEAKREEAKRDEAKREEAKREDAKREDAKREEARDDAATGPPELALTTLKEQLDYLDRYCRARVPCAEPALSSAERLVQLSGAETKALMLEIPRCIERCQK